MKELMRINAPKGQTIKYLDTGGYDTDLIQARKFLEKGKVYTVEKTEVFSWSTTVYLKEFPDERFNSSHFIEVGTVLKETETSGDLMKKRYGKPVC